MSWLTIIEAIKSGKAFKRDGLVARFGNTIDWWQIDWPDFAPKICKFDISYLRLEDLLADDWEVREE